jgi:hypothetical protein
MNFIIVIRCVEGETYEAIRADMTEQMVARGIKQVDMPLFAGLETSCHDAETEIEIIWISEELEKANFQKVLEKNYPKREFDICREIKVKAVYGRPTGEKLVIIDLDGKEEKYTRYTQNAWADGAGYVDEADEIMLERAYREHIENLAND